MQLRRRRCQRLLGPNFRTIQFDTIPHKLVPRPICDDPTRSLNDGNKGHVIKYLHVCIENHIHLTISQQSINIRISTPDMALHFRRKSIKRPFSVMPKHVRRDRVHVRQRDICAFPGGHRLAVVQRLAVRCADPSISENWLIDDADDRDAVEEQSNQGRKQGLPYAIA